MKKIIALLLAMMLVLSFFAGCSSEPSETPEEEEEIALKIGSTEFTAKDINFMYITTFNNMYSELYYNYGEQIGSIVDIKKPLEEQMFDDTYTWDEYILGTCVDTLLNYTGVYEKAMEAGFEIPEEYRAELDALEESYKKTAEEAGMTMEEYVSLMYGESVDFETIYKMSEFQYIVGSYAQEFQDGISVSDEDIRAYYEENKNNIDTVDFRFFISYYSDEEGALTEEEAIERAELIATAKTAEEFNAFAYEYAEEDLKEHYKDENGTLFPSATPETIGIEELSNWLFDESRIQGETYVYNDATFKGVISAMFEERVSADYNFVDVRHILIMPEKDESGKASEEAWAEAEKKANEIYDEYLAGEMTEEAFSELAKENSMDGNASVGGIYENVYKGQMVAPFENWCFDSARKTGDTGIVETSFGYHIMYFVGIGDNNLVSIVEPTIANGIFAEWVTANNANLEIEYFDAYETTGKIIDDIMAAAEERAAEEAKKSSEETGNVTNEEVVAETE
ncbi:MAG: peptidylprolyl isomerase [Oscillospiraceae bacterium]|nr:peptidylprolyl isomerase [Oscillospiraceae bacterium]